MKRFVVLFVVLVMSASFAVAQDGLGLNVGVEVGSLNDKGDFSFYLDPLVEYDNSFGAIDVYAKLDANIFVVYKADEDYPIWLTAQFLPMYNLSLSGSSTLSLGLKGIFVFVLSPDMDEKVTFGLGPRVKYLQNMSFGDIYGIFNLPITLVEPFVDDMALDLDVTLGWASNFGLGVEVTPYFSFLPDGVDKFNSIDLLVSYETGSIYGEIGVNIPKDIDYAGITISPYFEYSFSSMAAYLGTDIGFGFEDGGGCIKLYAGFKYSF